ncbi:hypothetical protein FB45DRAFT_869457 [Roridomyces roridus]|uniref:Uncharacterized protein n=1 Tax=Roridomyces roridus TaxID=1738132 RepID=A0AAD7FHF8_9AGAR|nr:hypothetical protein FB45DRAFT_869457 [Roridomyces roridus]
MSTVLLQLQGQTNMVWTAAAADGGLKYMSPHILGGFGCSLIGDQMPEKENGVAVLMQHHWFQAVNSIPLASPQLRSSAATPELPTWEYSSGWRANSAFLVLVFPDSMSFPVGTRVCFWDATGQPRYGTVQSISRGGDGTEMLNIKQDSTGTLITVPSSSVSKNFLLNIEFMRNNEKDRDNEGASLQTGVIICYRSCTLYTLRLTPTGGPQLVAVGLASGWKFQLKLDLVS